MKIGDYVRTKGGAIGRLVKEYTFNNGKVIYPEPQEWVLDINGNKIAITEDLDIPIKSSPNIKDLIEVGDVVVIEQNGDLYKYEVFSVPAFDKQKLYIYESILGKTKMLFLEDVPDEYIVRVLTHEEFDERSYKVWI